MKKQKKNLNSINKSWTLFLDRDGIINKKITSGYVCKWSDFKFKEDFLDTIPTLSHLFKQVIVITNQRCIAKKLISEVKLELIHSKMLKKINSIGGKINAIYFCPHDISDNCTCRKPNLGMVKQAIKDFDINLKKSIMIGDSTNDIELAKNAGMLSILISKNKKCIRNAKADFSFRTLNLFTQFFSYKRNQLPKVP